jgi:ABC-type sugar transport system ATPase subunit
VVEPAPTPCTETDRGPAISLTGVTRVFGSQPAIVGVRLEIGRGEVVLLRGANGAGIGTVDNTAMGSWGLSGQALTC